MPSPQGNSHLLASPCLSCFRMHCCKRCVVSWSGRITDRKQTRPLAVGPEHLLRTHILSHPQLGTPTTRSQFSLAAWISTFLGLAQLCSSRQRQSSQSIRTTGASHSHHQAPAAFAFTRLLYDNDPHLSRPHDCRPNQNCDFPRTPEARSSVIQA